MKETAEGFRKYLLLEGAAHAAHALQHCDQTGQLPTDDLVRRYARYGKTVVEVGAGARAGVAPAAGQKAPADLVLITSGEGVVGVPWGGAGLWNVRAIHIVPSPGGADANWDVHWATFVYGVQ